ncbi:hypothetical protein K438DRAFT_1781390 [Mycena galopus ATCC 62051]|nr:hypothetical protein K438DRAFT_1781390 [Mycena galopus ATCC 62051]
MSGREIDVQHGCKHRAKQSDGETAFEVGCGFFNEKARTYVYQKVHVVRRELRALRELRELTRELLASRLPTLLHIDTLALPDTASSRLAQNFVHAVGVVSSTPPARSVSQSSLLSVTACDGVAASLLDLNHALSPANSERLDAMILHVLQASAHLAILDLWRAKYPDRNNQTTEQSAKDSKYRRRALAEVVGGHYVHRAAVHAKFT